MVAIIIGKAHFAWPHVFFVFMVQFSQEAVGEGDPKKNPFGWVEGVKLKFKKKTFEGLFREEIQKDEIKIISSLSFSLKLGAICLNIDFKIYFPPYFFFFFQWCDFHSLSGVPVNFARYHQPNSSLFQMNII